MVEEAGTRYYAGELEVVDIVHFALSIRLEQNQSLEDTADVIVKDFEKFDAGGRPE